MNPTRPRTQAFTAGVVKSVSSDGQNTERAKEQRPVATIPARQPSETHVTGKKHADKHQNRHRCGAGDLHRPCLCTHLEITGERDQIVPIRLCRAAEKSSASTPWSKCLSKGFNRIKSRGTFRTLG